LIGNEVNDVEGGEGGRFLAEVSESSEKGEGGDAVCVPVAGDMDTPSTSQKINQKVKNNKINETADRYSNSKGHTNGEKGPRRGEERVLRRNEISYPKNEEGNSRQERSPVGNERVTKRGEGGEKRLVGNSSCSSKLFANDVVANNKSTHGSISSCVGKKGVGGGSRGNGGEGRIHGGKGEQEVISFMI